MPPCASVMAATSRGAAGRLGEPDVPAHVGLPEGGEVLQRPVHGLHQLVQRRERVARRALRGEHRHGELDGEPLVAGVAPAGEQLRRGRVGGRRRVGHERPAAAAARRRQVAALDERGERLAQRRARDAELRHSSRSAGSRVAGLSRPSLIAVPSRSSVSSNAVWDCDRREDVRCGARQRELHSRSKPRTRSQSVTAASNAASSIRALLR